MNILIAALLSANMHLTDTVPTETIQVPVKVEKRIDTIQIAKLLYADPEGFVKVSKGKAIRYGKVPVGGSNEMIVVDSIHFYLLPKNIRIDGDKVISASN